MNIRARFLTVLTLFPLFSFSQLPEPPEIPRFELSACAVGVDDPPELFWLDLEIDIYEQETREYRPLSIPVGARGSTVEIPLRPPIQLFREIRGEDGSRIKEPVLTLSEQELGNKVLLLLYRQPDGSGSMEVIDDSLASHPQGTVRFINLSVGRAVAAIGKQPVVIPPGKSVLLGTPAMNEKNRFPFNVAANVPGKPTYQDPTKLLRFRSPEHRLLVMFTFLPVYKVPESDLSEEVGPPVLTGYTPIAYRLYDRVKLPEPEE